MARARIAVIVATALALAGCGGTSGPAAPTTTQPAATSTSAAPATTTTTTLAPTTTTAATTTTAVLPVEVATREMLQEGDAPDYRVRLLVPEVVNHPVPAVGDEINDKIAAVFENEAERFVTDLVVFGTDEFGANTLDADFQVTQLGDGLLSMRIAFTSYYSGAAHPGTVAGALNYDLETGRQLGADDLLVGETFLTAEQQQALASLIAERLISYYYEGDANELEAFVPDRLVLYTQGHFWVTGGALGVWYDQYVAGPGAFGPMEAVIPFDELGDLLGPEGYAARVRS